MSARPVRPSDPLPSPATGAPARRSATTVPTIRIPHEAPR